MPKATAMYTIGGSPPVSVEMILQWVDDKVQMSFEEEITVLQWVPPMPPQKVVLTLRRASIDKDS